MGARGASIGGSTITVSKLLAAAVISLVEAKRIRTEAARPAGDMAVAFHPQAIVLTDQFAEAGRTGPTQEASAPT